MTLDLADLGETRSGWASTGKAQPDDGSPPPTDDAQAGTDAALARCAAVSRADFARRYWGAQPLLSAAGELPNQGDRAAFADLFSLSVVDDLLAERGLRTPFLRVAKNGTILPASAYTGSGGAGAEVADQVRDDALLALFLDGASLVLQGVHRLWPPVGEFARALAGELGCPTQVNAYVTPPQAQGFAPHYDVHDVFVLQIAGTKRWHVHPPVAPPPLRTEPWTNQRAAVAAAGAEPPVIDAELHPGDALYLPRGWLHSAVALGGVTCHLTVGVHPVTRHALAVALLDALTADLLAAPGGSTDLRSALPLGTDVGDREVVVEELRRVADSLAARLRALDPAPAADAVRDQVWRQTRPSPVRPLELARRIAELGAESRLCRRPHLAAVLVAAGERVRLELPDKRIELPAAVAEALQALLAATPHNPVTVGNLPGLTVDDALVLARRLLRESVCVVTP